MFTKRITLHANQYIVVSGDITDKGEYGLEWLCLLLDAKERYGDRVRLNLGNRDLNKRRWMQDLVIDRSWIGQSKEWWVKKQREEGYPLVKQSDIKEQAILIKDENDFEGCARWLEKHTFGAHNFCAMIWREHLRLQGLANCELDSSCEEDFRAMLDVHSHKGGLFFEYAREAKILDVLRVNGITYILSHSPATQTALAFWRTECSQPIPDDGEFDLVQLADKIDQFKNNALNDDSLLSLLPYQDREQASGLLVVGKQIQNGLIKRSEMVFEQYSSQVRRVFVFGHAPAKQAYSQIQGHALLSMDDSLATEENAFHAYVENGVLHWQTAFDGKSYPQSVPLASSSDNIIGTEVECDGIKYEVLGHLNKECYLLGTPDPNHTYNCEFTRAMMANGMWTLID